MTTPAREARDAPEAADERVQAESYDDAGTETLAARLGAARVVAFARVGSTQDEAHRLGAEGAPAGTVVLAEEQTRGRGRAGRAWRSAPDAGIWLTLLERPPDPSALDVLSLRLALRASAALDPFAAAPIRVKWPNDLYTGGGKLAGTLVEARWRDAKLDWVAIGFGLNVVAPPDVATAAGLAPGVRRLEVLEALVPALRSAARTTGPLSATELAEWSDRDLARGRRASSPVAGVVAGVSPTGELLVDTPSGRTPVRAGSLIFAEDAC
jgi:BirA family biotin operon repressor/biotin-[acetyl-CoA-carboxylase] ligase